MATSTITLGKVKFNWKGDWAQSTAYVKDDVVKYGPNVYTCLTAHTSQATFAPDLAKWDLMVAGVEYAGTWSGATLYKYGQLVSYGGAVYIALQESTNQNPYTETVYWTQLNEGQQFEGQYDNSTAYQKGDIVYYGGYLYVGKQNTTGNLPTETAYWDVYVKAYIDLGTWDSNITYKPGDAVRYGGSRYAVKEGQTPKGFYPTNGTYWEKVVDGLEWNGDWTDGTAYAPGDLVKHGGKVYKCTAETNSNAPDVNSNFTLFVDGLRWRGNYSNSNSYVVGDIVRLGGRSYICTDSYDNDGSTNPEPPNSDFWELFSDGFRWLGTYNAASEYEIGDVVEYAQSSYVSLVADNIGNTPSGGAPNWNLLAQGDSNAVMTTRGDIITRDATQAVRLPIGPAGSFLTSDGTDVTWGHLTPQNDYYVSPQGDDSNDGRTPTTSWATIKHACEQTFSLGQCRINVSSGTYTEQCPIRVGRSVVLEGNGLGAVTISPDTTNDNGFGVGISDDGSTPNANSYVFHMNNGSRMRNFVFRNFSTGSVLVSLDPGTGQDDTSVWITSQSPYVQNCTSFTPGGTGFKIDGGLHNGGYKSMVANDWTQINSDGVGIHVLNDGRSEIVSCFTYYCDIGYLAESGGKIRGIVGNNSYGEYGAVARGFSQAETPLVGKLRLNNQTINSLTKLSNDVHIFTSYRDSIGNRFFVGHTSPTGTDVTSTFDNTASYPFVAKFNSAGSLDWIYTYESAFGAIHSAVELSDKIYCGGVIYDGSNKGFILSLSKAGEIQWQKTIGDTSEITDLATDGNNLYGVGNHSTTGSSVIKLNPAGIEQWSRTLEYNDSSAANTLTATSCTFAGAPTTSVDTYALAGDATAENNLYIASYDSTANQSVITRINSSGGYVASYIYGDVRLNKLRLDTGNGDGIYLVAGGYYDPAGAVTRQGLLYRLSVDGVVQWQQQFPHASLNTEIKDVLPFGDDVYAVGYISDTDSTQTNQKGLIARYTSNGTADWIYSFRNSNDNLWFTGVTIDGVNVIVSGNEQNHSLILNVQRDTGLSIGTVTSGAYTLEDPAITPTASTVVGKNINEIDMSSLTLGVTDTTLTLNQTPTQTRTILATRAGFAGIGTGTTFSVDELDRSPKEGSVLQIDGDTETYFVIGVNNFLDGDSSDDGTCSITLDPPIPSNKTPNDQTTLTFREAYSQVRMSGHDFLDIGTGGFADTNYPVIIDADYTQAPDQTRETLSENGGRVFYVTTDQDGNFRVGDYFKVEQATGRATLSSEEFDLAGLNELQLGSITAGKTGATINEFSTDGTFADNSDTAVPTEKAIKTYVDNEITDAVGSLSQSEIKVGTTPSETKVEAIGSGISTDTVNIDVAGDTVFKVGNQFAIMPDGTTVERPGSPVEGMLRYNTTLGLMEQYNAVGWVPIDAPPTVSSVTGTLSESVDTTLTINGSNFKSGSVVSIEGDAVSGGSRALATTFVNAGQLTANTSASSSNYVPAVNFNIKVSNPSGLANVLSGAGTVDSTADFNSTAGSLATTAEEQALVALDAGVTDAEGDVHTYTVSSGSLPGGTVALNSTTGAITGTPAAESAETTYPFTVLATNTTKSGLNTSRSFTITVQPRPEISGVSSANLNSATITGTNFGASQGSVTINNAPTTITSWSDTSVTINPGDGGPSESIKVLKAAYSAINSVTQTTAISDAQVSALVSNYWGDASDGNVTISSNTNLSVTTNGSYDGNMVVKNYNNLTINSGVTLSTSQACRGMLLYVAGDLTLNGTISMRLRGANRDPNSNDDGGRSVNANGLLIRKRKSSGSVTSGTSDLGGAGSTAYNAETGNQPALSGSKPGIEIRIAKQGANGGTVTTSGSNQNGNSGSSGTQSVNANGITTIGTAGGGSGGRTGPDTTNIGNGSYGGPWGGGSAGGGRRHGYGGGFNATNAGVWSGAGGRGGYDGGNDWGGGGAGNPRGTPNWTGGSGTNIEAENGVGGLVILMVKGNITGSGTIDIRGGNGSNGNSSGGPASSPGGSSGGGACLILHSGTCSLGAGNISRGGGTVYTGIGSSSVTGGPGGTGSYAIIEVDE